MPYLDFPVNMNPGGDGKAGLQARQSGAMACWNIDIPAVRPGPRPSLEMGIGRLGGTFMGSTIAES